MKKYLISNWKMHGENHFLQHYFEELKQAFSCPLQDIKTEVILCLPFPYLEKGKQLMEGTGFKLGGQDCSGELEGAFTGEVSAKMLRDCAAEAVIVGHSERRQYHQENPALIRKKIDCVLQQGLKVIFCIGEKAEERAAHQTLKVLFEQCGSSLMDFKYQENMIIAYEPIWSIGTGKLPSLEEIEEVYQALKDFLPSLIGGIPPILYGGSVTAAFAQSLSKSALVDGFLVGKASLNPKEFYQISTFLR